MNKQFEAYYSPGWAWIWLIPIVIFSTAIILSLIFWSGYLSIILISPFSICILLFFLMFIKTKKQTGIAVEVADDILILHKKETISIPLKEIEKINIHDGDGSFDISIKSTIKRVSLHCFIKNQREKKSMFIDLLKNKGVNVSTFDLL